MFSSLLPKPKNTPYETVKIILPKNETKNKALLPKQLFDTSASVETRSKQVSTQEKQSSVKELFFNPDGSINYPQTLSNASGASVNVQASYEDTIPLKVRYPQLKHHFPSYTLENCPDDSLRKCVEETKQVIARLLAKATGGEEPEGDKTLHGYSSSTFRGNDTKTIEITNLKEDPMLPPKFKLRNNREAQAPPPPPVLKAVTTEKITKEVKSKWHIPSAVSNWKNNQGFTISLDKRVNAASGGAAAAEADFNFEKFSKLSLALETADADARKQLEEKHELRRNLASRERERKENDLRDMLERAKAHKRRAENDDAVRKRRH